MAKEKRAAETRTDVPLLCGDCLQEFSITYAETGYGEPTIEFCPFCGAESVTGPDEEEDDDDGEEHQDSGG